MANLCTKFEVLTFTHYEETKDKDMRQLKLLGYHVALFM